MVANHWQVNYHFLTVFFLFIYQITDQSWDFSRFITYLRFHVVFVSGMYKYKYKNISGEIALKVVIIEYIFRNHFLFQCFCLNYEVLSDRCQYELFDSH